LEYALFGGRKHVLSEAEIVAQLGDPTLRRRDRIKLIQRLYEDLDATAASVPVLGACARADDPTTRHAAIRALESIGTPAAVQQLRSCLRHPDDFTVSSAVRRLNELGAVAAIPEIVTVLQQRGPTFDPNARAALVVGLSGLLHKRPDPSAVEALSPCLLDRNHLTRKQAALTLGWLGTPEAMAALQWGAGKLGRRDRYHLERALSVDFPRSSLAKAQP
jgi:HEAT repeat protein